MRTGAAEAFGVPQTDRRSLGPAHPLRPLPKGAGPDGHISAGQRSRAWPAMLWCEGLVRARVFSTFLSPFLAPAWVGSWLKTLDTPNSS